MKIKKLVNSLGPGLLYAGAAVGVSHLVQSTRAGAEYGLYFIGILILTIIIKYPFFEFGPRYAAATGDSLIVGYKKIGKWALWIFGIITLATMFTIQAAVTVVTSGLLKYIFGFEVDLLFLNIGLLLLIVLLLYIGRYALLDKLIKYVIIVLTVSTLVAVVYATGAYSPEIALDGLSFDWVNPLHIAFLVSFIGWMPAPIDVSVWHSLWSVAKQKELGYRPKIKESLIDFKIGYIGTAFLALFFLILGAFVMYGSGEEFSPKGAIFAEQLIGLYTKTIGSWAFVLIAIAAFTTMFSTTLTCVDAFSRVMQRTSEELMGRSYDDVSSKRNYFIWIIILIIGTIIQFALVPSTMLTMIMVATTISFLVAPLLAILNYIVITHRHVPSESRPKLWLKIYAGVGIVFLTGFSIYYLITIFSASA